MDETEDVGDVKHEWGDALLQIKLCNRQNIREKNKNIDKKERDKLVFLFVCLMQKHGFRP